MTIEDPAVSDSPGIQSQAQGHHLHLQECFLIAIQRKRNWKQQHHLLSLIKRQTVGIRRKCFKYTVCFSLPSPAVTEVHTVPKQPNLTRQLATVQEAELQRKKKQVTILYTPDALIRQLNSSVKILKNTNILAPRHRGQDCCSGFSSHTHLQCKILKV